MNQARTTRRRFYQGLSSALHVVWPILSVVLCIIIVLGMAVSHFESWPLMDGVYFAFITGLTVGYGDLVPKHTISRLLAIGIGFAGILLTALFAAISVRALESAVGKSPDRDQAL